MPRDDARRPRPTSLARPARKVATLPGFASDRRTLPAGRERQNVPPIHPIYARSEVGCLLSFCRCCLRTQRPATAPTGRRRRRTAQPLGKPSPRLAESIRPDQRPRSRTSAHRAEPSRPRPQRAGFDLGRHGSPSGPVSRTPPGPRRHHRSAPFAGRAHHRPRATSSPTSGCTEKPWSIIASRQAPLAAGRSGRLRAHRIRHLRNGSTASRRAWTPSVAPASSWSCSTTCP